MGWIRRNLHPQQVSREDALPGRDTPVLAPMPTHEVFGRPLDEVPAGCEVAYFAMGCYWGAEKIFWRLPGVVNTAVGFAGGYTPNPTYKECCTGSTGHAETVRVVFDPQRISYNRLLKEFWEYHDPTTANRQGNDIGTQYRSAIFPTSEAQLLAAQRSAEVFQRSLDEVGRGSITTEITPDQTFYFAELEHQQYLSRNPGGYDCHVRTGIPCPLPGA